MEQILVLLSTYNGERYLREQIDSILNQQEVNLKLLIRDDGSSDNTRDIITEYHSKFPGIIEVIFGENLGYKLSFAYLIKAGLSRFHEIKFLAFSDQDDLWLNDKLFQGLNRIKDKDQSKPITYCSNTTLVDQSLSFIKNCWKANEVEISKSRCLIENFATGCTMIFNRRAAELFVSKKPKYLSVHDYWMYQICMFLGEVYFDHNSHIYYRQHNNNQIGRPGFFSRMKNRILGKFKRNAIEYRNKSFLECFGDSLSVEDKELILQVADYKRTISSRLRLILNTQIRYFSFEKNFFYIFKIIFGII